MDFSFSKLILVFESSEVSPVLITALSILGTATVFILIRVSTLVANSGFYGCSIKRFPFLDDREVKLRFIYENRKRASFHLGELSLWLTNGKKKMAKISDMVFPPVISKGNRDILTQKEGKYAIEIPPFSKGELVLDFYLTNAAEDATAFYLVAKDKKGHLCRAEIDLLTIEAQDLNFKKFRLPKEKNLSI